MTGDRFALLLNPSSGSADDETRDAVRAAVAGAGLDHAVYEVDGDPSVAARRAAAEGCTVLVACGGDGSVGAVAAVAAEEGRVLGVLPMGTLNHFARDLGLPADPVEAVKVLAAGVRRPVDLGCAGEVPFVNNASVGAYAELVARREKLERRLGKWRAAFVAARAVFPHRPVPVEVVVDGERIVRDATIVLFGNNEYVVADGRFTRERLDAGVLSVYVLRAPHVWDLVRIAYRIARDRVGRERALVRRTGTAITFSVPAERVLVAHDGEVDAQPVPFEVLVRPRALTVLAPG